MKTWYTVKAKADKPEEAEIDIHDEIGVWGITARDFISDLKKLPDSVKNLTLSVNSPGGSVFDGFAIYNALKNVREGGVTITAKVMGIAASAASFIVMASNKIVMPENSMMMVHYASALAWGNAEDMRDTADILDKIDNSLVGIYVARTGKTEDEVRALLKDESYMSAEQAKELGFADEVTENVRATASFEIDRLPANVQALFRTVQAQQTSPQNEPKADPVVDAEPTVAEQVQALAKESGFEAQAAFFATNYASVADAKAALTNAREIAALCAVAKKPDLSDRFIQDKKSVADVRAELCNSLASEDEQKPTSSARRNEHTPSDPQPVAGLKTADVWAARRNSHKGA